MELCLWSTSKSTHLHKTLNYSCLKFVTLSFKNLDDKKTQSVNFWVRVSTDIGSNKCQIHSTLLLLSLNRMIKWHQEVHIKKSLLASGGFKWHQEVQLLTHFLYFLKMAPKSYPLGKNFDFWVFWLKAATVWTAMLSRVQQSKNHTDRLKLTPQN